MRPLLCLFSTWLPMVLMSGQIFHSPLSLNCTAGSIGATDINDNIRTLEWTLGEVIIGSGNMNTYAVTQGEQQGIKNELHVGTTNAVYSQVTVFPNPASQFISIDKMPGGRKQISLHNYVGYPFMSFSTHEEFISIPSSLLPSGLYLLTIHCESQQAQTFKISILQY